MTSAQPQLTIGAMYRAKDLPAGSVVTMFTDSEYVKCSRIDSVMRWEQPIPGSGEWLVTYVGQLPEGETMTEREKQEVLAARQLPAVGSALTLPDGTTGRVVRHTVEEGQRVAVLSGTGAHEGETHHVASRDLA